MDNSDKEFIRSMITETIIATLLGAIIGYMICRLIEYLFFK